MRVVSLEGDRTMPKTISWSLQMAVRDGRLNDARELMSEMVASTWEEPGGSRIRVVPQRRRQDLPY
jgi:hypothetical protein